MVCDETNRTLHVELTTKFKPNFDDFHKRVEWYDVTGPETRQPVAFRWVSHAKTQPRQFHNLNLTRIPPINHQYWRMLVIMSNTRRAFKRPFQPSLTSYFGNPDRDQAEVTRSHSQTSISNLPSLPTFIQSSLLNVGMRVRKSVPEGYKTKPTGSPINCPIDPNARSSHEYSPASKELLPYCGILKIGNHQSQQPVPDRMDLPPLHFDEGDDWDFPSSQDSDTSLVFRNPKFISTPMPPNKHKRQRDDQGDEEEDSQTSPFSSSYTISHTRMPNLDKVRTIAQPKTRIRQQLLTDAYCSDEMVDFDDFEEAIFLRPDEWGMEDGC